MTSEARQRGVGAVLILYFNGFPALSARTLPGETGSDMGNLVAQCSGDRVSDNAVEGFRFRSTAQ